MCGGSQEPAAIEWAVPAALRSRQKQCAASMEYSGLRRRDKANRVSANYALMRHRNAICGRPTGAVHRGLRAARQPRGASSSVVHNARQPQEREGEKKPRRKSRDRRERAGSAHTVAGTTNAAWSHRLLVFRQQCRQCLRHCPTASLIIALGTACCTVENARRGMGRVYF